MISNILSAELSATCNALGYSNGSKYYIDPYVKETMTDLIRYLRRDDEDHTIRRHLGCAKVLQTDLLPILIHHSDKEDLFDVLLRLLVNLTNPALLIYQEELPAERTARHYFLQMISQLQSYKQAFTVQRVWEILAKKLGDLLQVPYHERDEDQSRVMERILILVRNVLQVPADSDFEKRPDNDASTHDQVLWSLHQAGMVDLFLYIASTDNEQQYYMHILEVVSLMLREQNPATLASAVMQRSVEEKEQDEKELLQIRQKEIMEKQSKFKKYAGTRHSRFGGTFVVKNVKSISENDLIYHKPVSTATNLNFDSSKQKSKVHKNKISLMYSTSERRSAFSVRLFLKEFCVEFLNGAYNPLMHKVRENLMRAVGQPNDETYYFWAMKFFMEFNRLYKFQVKLISETMHQHTFHFVQTQMEKWLEQMIVDKKKIPIWSRRVHQALKAYQELLMTLQAMDRSPDHSVRESSRIIKSNIFYQSEYRELVVFLFNVYTETKFSRQYLKDLVETTHIFIKMLGQFCARYQNVMVQAKAKKMPKKKKKAAKAKKSSGATAQALEAIWDQVGPELSAVLQSGADLPTVVPFDATLDLSPQQQKIEAMKRIQMELKEGNFEQAIGLLRASREVWPENDSFGQADMAPDEEFMAMREIFMADIGQPAETTADDDKEGSEERSEDEEEDPGNIVIPEQPFKLIEFVARFACPRVLSAVCTLLGQFERNSVFTNHCIVKLLYRVAWDCKMPTMLFQASLFRTFQRIFRSINSDHKELKKFAIFIMRKFVQISKTNKKIYMELLFWKSKKEAEEIEVGYGNGTTKSYSSKNVWREEQEDELRRLAVEYERDTPEPDAVGWIMKNMIDQSRTRRAVIKKMKELYLVVGNIKPSKVSKPKEFSEEEANELRALYEEFKNAADPMNCILGRMSITRSRKTVVNKLIEMGLVSDGKQLRKKSDKKKDKSSSKNPWEKRSDDESIYDSWSDSDGERAVPSFNEKGTPRVHKSQASKAQMCCSLKKVMEADMAEALEWLKTSLQEAMEDLGDEEDEDGTALLPLTPHCVQAMDNPQFLQLLDALSIDQPTDQEIYWRVPGRWKAQDITERISIITDALEGRLPEEVLDLEDRENCSRLSSSPNSSVKIKKLKKTKRRSRNIAVERSRTPSSDSDVDSSETREENNSSNSKSHKRKSRHMKKQHLNTSELDKEHSFASSSSASDIDNVSNKENCNKQSSMSQRGMLLNNVESEDSQSQNSCNIDGILSDNKTQYREGKKQTPNHSLGSASSEEENTSREKNRLSNRKKNLYVESDSDNENKSIDSRKSPIGSPDQSSITSSGVEHFHKSTSKSKNRLNEESDSDIENSMPVQNNSSLSPTHSPSAMTGTIEEQESQKSSEFNSPFQRNIENPKRKRLNIESDSEDENAQSSLVINSVEHVSTADGSKRKRLIISSDSDD